MPNDWPFTEPLYGLKSHCQSAPLSLSTVSTPPTDFCVPVLLPVLPPQDASSRIAPRPMPNSRCPLMPEFLLNLKWRSRRGRLRVPHGGARKNPISRNLERDRHRPAQDRVVAQGRYRDPGPEGEQLAQLPLDRLHEQVAVATDAAAEDDHLRVEHRGHGGDGEAQHRRLRLHDPASNRVAAPGGDEDPLRSQGRENSETACRTHDADPGCSRLASPAAAAGRVARVAFAKRHGRDLPRRPVRASLD